MVVLGLLLLLASAGITLGIVLDNTDEVTASAFGVSLSNVSVGGLFLAGVVAGGILMLGLGMLLMGGARKRSKHVETKRRVSRVRSEKEELAQENAALRAQLEPTSDAPSERV